MNTFDIDWIVTPPEDGGTIDLGAHLVSEREGYSHHGIYAGNGQVIHYGGFRHSVGRRPVESVSLQGFAAGRRIGVRSEPDAVYRGMLVVARAQSRLGEDRYRILTNNCEHFCSWCLRGRARSEQVRLCFSHPWFGAKTLLALVRSSHAFRLWASRGTRLTARVRSSIWMESFVARFG